MENENGEEFQQRFGTYSDQKSLQEIIIIPLTVFYFLLSISSSGNVLAYIIYRTITVHCCKLQIIHVIDFMLYQWVFVIKSLTKSKVANSWIYKALLRLAWGEFFESTLC